MGDPYPQPYQQYPQQYPGHPGYVPPPLLPPGVEFASWGRRFAAYLVDCLTIFGCLLPAVPFAVLVELTADPVTDEPPLWSPILLAAVAVAGVLAWLWNYCWQMGAKGQSWGKQVLGIHLVRVPDLRPPGGGTSVGRYVTRSFLRHRQ